MKKVTVGVAIPAYNEEVTIGNMLTSLLKQKADKFDFKSITVYSDGSTDKTHEIVREFEKKSNLVKLVTDGKQIGKYARLNQLFRDCKTDQLVVLDADIALVGNDFLEKLISFAANDPKAVLTTAHIHLIRSKGFIAKLLHTSFAFWDNVRLSIPGYDVATNYHGAATTYEGKFIRTFQIPSNLSDPHLYIYLAAHVRDGFRYCRDAVVLQYPPTTIEDMKRILKRTLGKRDIELEKIFTPELIAQVHTIPRKYKIKGIIQTFFEYPFYTPLALLLSFYVGRLQDSMEVNKTVVWEITTSTKKPIVNEN